jgi:glycosyltransferase involved in cell wall biosynthesis
MRILHVIASANPEDGGPIEGVRLLSEVLAETGHIRKIVSLDSPDADWVKTFPITVHAIGDQGQSNRRRFSRLPWVRYGYTRALIPWLKQNSSKYDGIIINGLWNYAAFASRWALDPKTTPYVVFTHGMLDPWFRRTYPVKTIVKQIFWWFVEGPLLARAKWVLFTTEEERRLARGSFWPYRCNEKVIGYGTLADVADPRGRREAFYRMMPHLEHQRFLLFLSRIHPKKGCDLLIRAFATVARHDPKLQLVMAGPDQIGWTAELKKLASALGVEKRISWPGMLTGAVKWGAYRACEAFVLPSHQENFGIVVAEAMACGKPVLITNKVNIWREIERCGGGIVASDTQDGIENLLRGFCNLSPSERDAMGRSGYQNDWKRSRGLLTFRNSEPRRRQ